MPFCNNCGREFAPGTQFCPSCGRSTAPVVTQAPTLTPTYYPSPPKSQRSLVLAIVVVVVLVVIIVGVIAAVFVGSFVSSVAKTDVYVSAINDHWDLTATASNGLLTASQPVTGYDTLSVGRSYAEGDSFVYSLTIPPLNDSSCTSMSVTISSASLETPGFTLDSVSPNLPITYNAGSLTLSLSITTPNHPYTGTLGVLFTGSIYCTT